MRCLFAVLILALSSSLVAAPGGSRYSERDEMRGAVVALQHEVGNNQLEMRAFEERLANLDATIEALLREVTVAKQTQKEKLSSAGKDFDSRLGSLDLSVKGAVADIKTIKTQLNDSTATLGQFKQRIGDLEKVIASQNQNIDALQVAVRTMVEALQGKESGKPTKSYAVKSGDALEKIARTHGMTLEEIMELNGLTSPKILIGQKLQVHDK